MSDLTRIPVTLLTGFLGSGKTTLINRVIRLPELAETVVVVNEFGSIGIDHALIVSSDDNIIVLENGCMCCTVRGGLLDTLTMLFSSRTAGDIKPFKHLLVETSGLADPVPILQALLSEPTLEGRYRMARVVTTYDCINGPDTLRNHSESLRQLAVANDIIVTKRDLLPSPAAAAWDATTQMLRKINPAAKIHHAGDLGDALPGLLRDSTPDPTVDPSQILAWLNIAAYDHDHDQHHAHASQPQSLHLDDIASLSYVSEQPLPREALHLLLRALEDNLGPNLLRVKGLVHIAEDPERPVVIHGAQHLLHNVMQLDAWPDQDRRTRMVFIAQGIAKQSVEEMIALLARVATRTANARIRATAASAAAAL